LQELNSISATTNQHNYQHNYQHIRLNEVLEVEVPFIDKGIDPTDLCEPALLPELP
jgi:hypothetical protein